jgi:hypothetical protein
MDLLKELDGSGCYFEETLSDEVKQMLDAAADSYGEEGAEMLLLRAFLRAPASLTVLVALYRYYFYQHRLHNALQVADRAMHLSGEAIGLAYAWPELQAADFDRQAAGQVSMGRFYLFALKGAGYMNMRIGKVELGTAQLRKVRELDPEDRLGAGILLDVVDYKQGLRVVN